MLPPTEEKRLLKQTRTLAPSNAAPAMKNTAAVPSTKPNQRRIGLAMFALCIKFFFTILV